MKCELFQNGQWCCWEESPLLFRPSEFSLKPRWASSRQVHRKRAAEALAGVSAHPSAALGTRGLGRFAQPPWDGEKVPRAKIRIHGQRETGGAGNQKSLTLPREVLMSGLGFHTTEGAPSLWLKNSGTKGWRGFQNVLGQCSSWSGASMSGTTETHLPRASILFEGWRVRTV